MPCPKHGKYILTEWTRLDEKLLQAVKKGSSDGVQQLFMASNKCRIDPVKLDPNRGTTALHVAAAKGLTSIVDQLLRQAIDSDVRDIRGIDATEAATAAAGGGCCGRTALHCAARNARYDVTQRLLQNAADVNIIDHDSWSVLHHASFGGHLGCVQLLLSADAPVFVKDKQGRTALLYAAWKGQASVCRLLLEHGANVDDADKEHRYFCSVHQLQRRRIRGRTALMLAAERGNSAVCEYLISKGADVARTDVNGHDAYWYSRKHNQHEVTKLLEQLACRLPRTADCEQRRETPMKPKRRLLSENATTDNQLTISAVVSPDTPDASELPVTARTRCDYNQQSTSGGRDCTLTKLAVVDDAPAANGNDSDDSAISADNHRKPRSIAVDTDSNSDSDSESVFDDVERIHDDNICELQPTDDRLLSSATDDDDDNNTGSQLTVCDVVDHLRRRVSELENQKSAMQLELDELLEKTVYEQLAGNNQQPTFCYSRLISQLSEIHSQLHHLVNFELQSGRQSPDETVAQFKQVCRQLATLADVDCAAECREEKTARSRLRQLSTENQSLQFRLDEILHENKRELTVDLEGVETLMKVAQEFKQENEALLADYKNLKRQLVADTLSRQFDETTEQTDDYIVDDVESTIVAETLPDGGQFQDSRRAIERHKQKSEAMAWLSGDEGSSIHAQTSVSPPTKSSGASEIIPAERQEKGVVDIGTMTSALTEDKTSTTELERSYKELYEELQEQLADMEENLGKSNSFQREFQLLNEENEGMVQMIAELRSKMDCKCAEVQSLKRRVTELEKQLVSQIDEFSVALKRLLNRKGSEQSVSRIGSSIDGQSVADKDHRRIPEESSFGQNQGHLLNESSQSSHGTESPGSPVIWTIGSGSGSRSSDSEISDKQIGADCSKVETRLENPPPYALHVSPSEQHGVSSPSGNIVESTKRSCCRDGSCSHGRQRNSAAGERTASDATLQISKKQIENITDIEILRCYADELLDEVAALKRTVLEQGRYLSTTERPTLTDDEITSTTVVRAHVDNANTVGKSLATNGHAVNARSVPWQLVAGQAAVANGSSFSNAQLRATGGCGGKPGVFRTSLDIIVTENSLKQNCSMQLSPIYQTSGGVIVGGVLQTSGQDGTGHVSEPKGELKPVSASSPRLASGAGTDSSVTFEKRGSSEMAGSSGISPKNEKSYKTSFGEVKVAHVDSIGYNHELAMLKRAWSEGDLQQLKVSGGNGRLVSHSSQRHHHNKATTLNQFSSEELPARHVTREEDVDEYDADQRASTISYEADIVEKYNALVAGLRKTCDLVNSAQSSIICSEEDCLSVDELLLLVNSYEQLAADKNSLEEENRALIIELDQLTAQLVRAKGRQSESEGLSAIAEEDLKEELAELEHELEGKNAQVAAVEAALRESRRHAETLEQNVGQLEAHLNSLCMMTQTTSFELLLSQENDKLTSELQQIRNVESSLRQQLERKTVECQQLSEEVVRLKEKTSASEDPDFTMFCLQEKLAGEVDQLTEQLTTKVTELKENQQTCQKLQDKCKSLEQALQKVAECKCTEKRQSTDDNVTSYYKSEVYEKLLEKVVVLQMANNNLLDERARLILNLKSEMVKNNTPTDVIRRYLEPAPSITDAIGRNDDVVPDLETFSDLIKRYRNRSALGLQQLVHGDLSEAKVTANGSGLDCTDLVSQMQAHNARLRHFVAVLERKFQSTSHQYLPRPATFDECVKVTQNKSSKPVDEFQPSNQSQADENASSVIVQQQVGRGTTPQLMDLFRLRHSDV